MSRTAAGAAAGLAGRRCAAAGGAPRRRRTTAMIHGPTGLAERKNTVHPFVVVSESMATIMSELLPAVRAGALGGLLLLAPRPAPAQTSDPAALAVQDRSASEASARDGFGPAL